MIQQVREKEMASTFRSRDEINDMHVTSKFKNYKVLIKINNEFGRYKNWKGTLSSPRKKKILYFIYYSIFE